ncbi:High-affinity glucose transporter [Paramyrothecium foliicola]|nr:High-affinity glucose transporter [Paramyrothecium foliicola]
MVASVGGAMYGVDTARFDPGKTGIIATTIGHKSFNMYMFPPDGKDTVLTGAVVSVYNAGQAAGTFVGGWAADKLSRRRAISLACTIAIVGIVLQTAAVNIGMFITGRLLTGISSGMILPVVPVYIAELSKPKSRGIVVGFQGMGIAIGFCLANWIGYGGIYASGNAQWRIPLAMQFPCAVFLLVGSFFIPESPRWLVGQDRHAEANDVLRSVHGTEDADYIQREMIQISEQISLEKSIGSQGALATFAKLFSKQFIFRVGLSCFVQTMTQFAGVGVIQNFQNIFYSAVGFTGNTALLISAIYGFMGVIGQFISLTVVADKWRRTTTLWVGCMVLASLLAICMALSAQYSDGSNMAASRATVAFIFIYSAAYAIFFNSTTWVVGSELLPVFLRSKGMALATFCNGVASIVMSQITPIAMENINWRYYAVFIASNILAAYVYKFHLPETKGLTLEEIGALFGDAMATRNIDEIDVDAKADLHAHAEVVELERR